MSCVAYLFISISRYQVSANGRGSGAKVNVLAFQVAPRISLSEVLSNITQRLRVDSHQDFAVLFHREGEASCGVSGSSCGGEGKKIHVVSSNIL